MHLARITLAAALVAALLFPCFDFAQAQQPAQQHRPPLQQKQLTEFVAPSMPATKLEALASQPGILVIRRSWLIGRLPGKRGSIAVLLKDFADVGNPGQRATGLGFLVEEPGKSRRTSFVDYDEIDSLIQAVDYISTIDQKATSGKDLEAVFQTKGGFIVWAGNRGKGEIVATVSSRGLEDETVASLNFSDLPQLKKLIQDGKASLDADR
jgi:hypothetical protein